MTRPSSAPEQKLAERLILDELFDLSLYTALRDVTTADVRRTLEAGGVGADATA